MAPVEGPGIAREERAHAARQGPPPCPEQEVGMVREEGPGIHGEAGCLHQRPDPGAEVAPISVVPENGSALEAAHHHVVEDPRGIQAGLAGHDQRTISQSSFGSNVPHDVPHECQGGVLPRPRRSIDPSDCPPPYTAESRFLRGDASPAVQGLQFTTERGCTLEGVGHRHFPMSQINRGKPDLIQVGGIRPE